MAAQGARQSKQSTFQPDHRLSASLEFLSKKLSPQRPSPGQIAPPECFPACSSPDVRTCPQFSLPYRRPLLIRPIPVDFGVDDDPDSLGSPALRLACVRVIPPKGLEVFVAYDLRFEQIWNLHRVSIGDLSSTIGLAPGEQLTLEFQFTQRRVLEQSRIDSAEEMNSTESTTSDKEAINTARASSETENWHVDGNGAFSIGPVKLGASGGSGGNTSQSAQSSVNHITEATKRSAQSLKTLHKIEVRGVSETLMQNRMTRIIKNPYRDRTLSLNIFQLLKHFSVATALTEIRLALVLAINDLEFDKGFVVAYTDFLRATLLDSTLVDDLPLALKGAQQLTPGDPLHAATDVAKLALKYLYDEPNLFNVPHVVDVRLAGAGDQGDANDPKTSFDASKVGSGLSDALTHKLGVIYTILGFFFQVYQEKKQNGTLDDTAVALAKTLADNITPGWAVTVADPLSADRVMGVLDENQFTEIFRRLSGFLAMVNSMLQPLLAIAEEDRKAMLELKEATATLARLIEHLHCHKNFYIQNLMAYLAAQTDNQDIVDFVRRVIDRLGMSSEDRERALSIFDVERSFIDRQQIVVPTFAPLTQKHVNGIARVIGGPSSSSVTDISQPFQFEDVVPAIAELEVPCDGIHLEVAPGACVLPQLPDDGGMFEASIGATSVRRSG